MDIYVKDKNYVVVGVLDVVESFIWTDRYSGFGDFELYTPVSDKALALLQEDFYLEIKESDRTMIIESIQIKTDVEKGNRLLVKGRSLESIMDRRIVWYLTDINTDIQNAVLTLVGNSMLFITPEGTDGATHRKIQNMAWSYNSDTRLNALTVNGRFIHDEVYTVVKNLCDSVDVGFKIILNPDDNFFYVSVYLGNDRSYNQTTNPYVVFSPTFDNLINSNYIWTKERYKNLAMIFGYITDTGQLHRVLGTSDVYSSHVGLDQREVFIDATHISRFVDGTTTPIDVTLYDQKLRTYGYYQVLMQRRITSAFEGQADTTNNFVYRQDFFLGDIVQIENEYGITGRARITELTITENASGHFVYPTFAMI